VFGGVRASSFSAELWTGAGWRINKNGSNFRKSDRVYANKVNRSASITVDQCSQDARCRDSDQGHEEERGEREAAH